MREKPTASVLLPTKDVNKGGARLDSRAVREAVEFFGLTLPVEFKWANGRHRAGAHRFRYQPAYLGKPATHKHVITLSTYMEAERMSEVVWHELAHAAQCEELGSDKFDAAYARENRYVGYEHNRFEREARGYESFSTELPLAA